MQLPPNSPSSPTPLLSRAPALPHLQNHASPARPTSSHCAIEALDLAVRHDQQPTNIQSVTITLHADTIEAIHKQLERPNIIGSISGSTGNNDLDQLLLSLYRVQHGFPFFEERLSQLRSFVMPPPSPPSPTDTNSSGSSIWHAVDSFSSEHELAATLAEMNIITSAKRGQRQDHATRGGTTPPSMPVSPSRPLRCIPTSPPPPSAHPLRFELPSSIASSKRALPIHNVSSSDKSDQDSSRIQQATKATIAQPIHPDDPGAAPGQSLLDLHRALADKHNGRARWGYSESISYSLDHTHYQDIATAAQSSSSDSSGPHPNPPASAADDRASADGATVNGDSDEIVISGRNGSQGQGGLDWLLNNASRAAVADGDVVEKAQSEADNASELPHWLRAKPDALQVISDKKTTAQVYVLSPTFRLQWGS
ncbi:hypothetical protein NUW54_g8804 [Trametes sanguinea]|uniref:Uncharacterized protein n=1 Tax=Trametes sanguinea TaxID=158606 RepID=A0ACC1PBX6_9APHY|nr:hypothetical protein NUW54_g8804 [Trametes sanguinea]